MSIIDKTGQIPNKVEELDNGDIVYHYSNAQYRYAVEGVYVQSIGTDHIGREFLVMEDDSIEIFQWARGCSWLAIDGDEPLFELGKILVDTQADVTPSAHSDRQTGMKIWFELPKIYLCFSMEGDLIEIEDLFTGDSYFASSVEGAMDRLAWLMSCEEKLEILEVTAAAREAKEKEWQEFLSDVDAECGECGKELPRNQMNHIGKDGETDVKTGYECDECYSRGIEGDEL